MTLTLRHRSALKQARQLHQRAVLLQALRSYQRARSTAPSLATRFQRATARISAFWNRLAEAAWDIHDNCEALWALIFMIVMFASCAAVIALIALACGWTP